MADKLETTSGISASAKNYGSGDPHQDSRPTSDTWDEERLEYAMKMLKEMHIELRNLRTTIPRLIAPLAMHHSTPQILFQEFSKSINKANREIEEFRRLVTDEQRSQVFEYTRKIHAENSSFISPWNIIEHPDWLNRDV